MVTILVIPSGTRHVCTIAHASVYCYFRQFYLHFCFAVFLAIFANLETKIYLSLSRELTPFSVFFHVVIGILSHSLLVCLIHHLVLSAIQLMLPIQATLNDGHSSLWVSFSCWICQVRLRIISCRRLPFKNSLLITSHGEFLYYQRTFSIYLCCYLFTCQWCESIFLWKSAFLRLHCRILSWLSTPMCCLNRFSGLTFSVPHWTVNVVDSTFDIHICNDYRAI